LLPLIEREIPEVALSGVHQAARHTPAVLQIHFAGNLPQLHLEEGLRDRGHRLGIDP